MANILVNIEKGIEIGAEDALKWISGAQSDLKAAPAVVAGLGTLLGAVATAISSADAAAQAGGLNIALDEATVTAIKAVWPQIVSFAAQFGIKL